MNRPLLICFSVSLGALVGVGFYTFIYAKGISYMSNKPEVCANCHIMNKEYDGWIKSTHHAVAVCNDCHTPHNILGKYSTKAYNGFWHSFYFTSGWYPDQIPITTRNRGIVEANCRRCHEDVVYAIDGVHTTNDSLSCLKCHKEVGHP